MTWSRPVRDYKLDLDMVVKFAILFNRNLSDRSYIIMCVEKKDLYASWSGSQASPEYRDTMFFIFLSSSFSVLWPRRSQRQRTCDWQTLGNGYTPIPTGPAA